MTTFLTALTVEQLSKGEMNTQKKKTDNLQNFKSDKSEIGHRRINFQDWFMFSVCDTSIFLWCFWLKRLFTCVYSRSLQSGHFCHEHFRYVITFTHRVTIVTKWWRGKTIRLQIKIFVLTSKMHANMPEIQLVFWSKHSLVH